jgi:NAD-dependent SIR2 family protein deacetylase
MSDMKFSKFITLLNRHRLKYILIRQNLDNKNELGEFGKKKLITDSLI